NIRESCVRSPQSEPIYHINQQHQQQRQPHHQQQQLYYQQQPVQISEELIGDKMNSTDYDIVSITSVPIFFKKCPEGHGELNRFSDPYCDTTCEESHVQLSKEMATYVVLKRK